VVVELSDDGALRFEVRDDGAGSHTDNVTAVGGELAIGSSPGRGTRVSGTIPLNEAM